MRDLCGLALLLAASSQGTLLLEFRTDGITTIWPSNGLLLGVLLLAPKRHWPAYFGVAFLVDCAVTGAHSGYSLDSLSLSLCNMLEVFLALFALSIVLPRSVDFTRIRQLLQFLFFGAIVAPAVATLVAVAVATPFGDPGLLSGYGSWFAADALGIATVTPLYIALVRRDLRVLKNRWEILGIFLLVVLITLVVFGQTRFPLLFLIPPFLLLAEVRLGLVGATLGLTIVSVLGGYMTSLGLGPVALVPHATTSQHILVFQFFIASSICLLYGAEVLIGRNRVLQQAVAASESRFRLLTEASRDIIILSDLDGRREYVSPAITEVLGWTPEQLLHGSLGDIVHPEDKVIVDSLLDNCRRGHEQQAISYRCRKTDNSYVWVETNVRRNLDPKTGQPTGLVSATRDISGRKAAEEQLQAAYQEVEALSTLDALTGLANRRRLDEVLENEWRRALRDRSCLSVLMVDVDCFKAYNDLYGHLRGDACLRRIARAASEVARRPGDLVARYGGEEFAVVLPNTGEDGSREIAEEIRRAVEKRSMSHEGNSYRKVTVSIGCATVDLRQSNFEISDLIGAADQALYQAKREGRNRVCRGTENLRDQTESRSA